MATKKSVNFGYCLERCEIFLYNFPRACKSFFANFSSLFTQLLLLGNKHELQTSSRKLRKKSKITYAPGRL
jgi:hypothetical protein